MENYSVFNNIKRAIPYGEIQANTQSYLKTAQPQMRALLSMKENTERSLDMKTAFIGALTVDDNIITDKVLDSVASFQDKADFTGEVSEETAYAIHDTFVDMIASNQYSTTSDVTNVGMFVVTSESGNAYGFKADDSLHDIPNSTAKGLVLTCDRPLSIYDTLVYYDNGHYYINPIVRSVDYNLDYQEFEQADTVLDRVQAVAYLQGCNVYDSIFDTLKSIAHGLNVTVYDADDILTLFNRINIISKDNISDAAIELFSEYGIVNNPKGTVELIYDLLDEISESAALDEVMCKSYPLLLKADTTYESFQSLANSVETRYSSVQMYLSGLMNAFSNGGILSAISYILHYGEAGASLTGEDGYMKFSNNEDLVPQNFIVGIIGTSLTVIGDIALLVGGIFGKIIGGVLAITGFVLSKIQEGLAYNYKTAVHAQLNIDHRVTFPIAPVSCFQTVVAKNTPLGVFFQSVVDQTSAMNIVEVPGGFLIIGEYSETEYCFEFHPSIINHIPLAQQLWDNGFTFTGYYTEVDANYKVQTMTIQNISYIRDTIRLYYNDDQWIGDNHLSNTIFEEDGSAALSSEDDELLRKIIICNTFLFICFTLFSDNPLNPYSNQEIVVDRFTGKIFSSPGVNKSYNLLYSVLPLFEDDAIPSWDILVTNFDTFASTNMGDATLLFTSYMQSYFSRRFYIGDIIPLSNNEIHYACKVPKYDKTSFWLFVGIAIAATVAVTFIAIKSSVKFKKWQRAKAAENARNCEAAWEAYKANPTAENQKAYFKAVKKNNRMAKWTGGTKYSKTGFWASTDSSAGATTDRNTSGFLSSINQFQDESSTNGTICDVVRLINGIA